MKKISKVLVLILAVALVFSVTGCDKKKKDNKKALETLNKLVEVTNDIR